MSKGPRRGVVISNCQSQPLKHILSLLCEDVLFDALGVHLFGPERDSEIDQFVRDAQQTYDYVVAIGLSGDFGPLAIERIRDSFPGKPVILITNLYYTGVHPDIVYIGGMSQRLQGPLTDYHSRVALTGFLRGMSVDEIKRLYTASTYEKLGFLQAHDRSITELTDRETGHDVHAVPLIQEMFRDVPLFMSVNHPTSHLIWAYGQKIAQYLADHYGVGLSGWTGGPAQMVNYLGSAPVFPVYPEIAAALGIRYPTAYVFKPDAFGDTPVNTMNLDQFVEGEMRSFESIPFAELENSHQGIEILQFQGHIDLAL